jgi:hypothetical protein
VGSQAAQLLPGRSPVGDQAGTSEDPLTGISTTGNKRKKSTKKEWSRQDCIHLIECYLYDTYN